MPKRLTKDEATATDTYARFFAEPFENLDRLGHDLRADAVAGQ